MSAIEPPFKNVRVLLLEDDFIILMNNMETLQALGCDVVPCVDNAEAFDALGRSPPQAALLDVNIGGNTSYAVAEALEQIGVPVGFLTGYASAALDKKWQNRPHCEKPCDKSDLWALLDRILLRRKKTPSSR